MLGPYEINLQQSAYTEAHKHNTKENNRTEKDRVKVTSSNMASAACATIATRHYYMKTI